MVEDCLSNGFQPGPQSSNVGCLSLVFFLFSLSLYIYIHQTMEIKSIPMTSPSMLTVLSRIPLLWAGIYLLDESVLVYAR